jgi:O-antigen/teichoic acid export membrane protein
MSSDDPASAAEIRPAVQGKSTRRRLLSSFAVQAASIWLRTAQQLLLVPILLYCWGRDVYQDWIVLFSAAGFLSFLDLGLGVYSQNVMLIAWSRNDHAAYRRHAAIGFLLYAAVVASAVAILALSAAFVSWPNTLGIRSLHAIDALWTVGLLAASSLVMLPLTILGAAYRARGDNAISLASSVFIDTARGIGVAAIALLGGQPVVAAWLYLIIALLGWSAIYADQYRRYGEVLRTAARPTGKEFREAVEQAGLYTLPILSTPLTLNLPIILLGALSPIPGAAVAFTVARTYTGLLRQGIVQLAQAVGLEMARAIAGGNTLSAQRLFREGGRLFSGIAGGLAGLALVLAEPFIRFWTHGQVAYDPLLIAVFAVNIVFMAPAQSGFMFFYFTNSPRALVAANGGYALLSVLLCFLLIGKFSAAGAAFAVGISEFVFVGLYLVVAASARISVPLLSYVAQSYAVAIVSLAAGYGVAFALSEFMQPRTFLQFCGFGAAWGLCVCVPAFYLVVGRELRTWLLKGALRLMRLDRAAKAGDAT